MKRVGAEEPVLVESPRGVDAQDQRVISAAPARLQAGDDPIMKLRLVAPRARNALAHLTGRALGDDHLELADGRVADDALARDVHGAESRTREAQVSLAKEEIPFPPVAQAVTENGTELPVVRNVGTS